MSDHINKYRDDLKTVANLKSGLGTRVDRVFARQAHGSNSGYFIEKLPSASKTSAGIGGSSPAPFMLGHSVLGGPDSLGGV